MQSLRPASPGLFARGHAAGGTAGASLGPSGGRHAREPRLAEAGQKQKLKALRRGEAPSIIDYLLTCVLIYLLIDL